MNLQKIAALAAIDEQKLALCDLSDRIWDHPETNFLELYAAREQGRLLEELGFSVEGNLAGMPSAFRAVRGSGKPVMQMPRSCSSEEKSSALKQ